jgi:type II restriction enzyme
LKQNSDIECLYLTKNKKFAVDAKSTQNKLSWINAWRLTRHRQLIWWAYTIVITPRYVPSVKYDIIWTEIVVVLASTFAEYLYNNMNQADYKIDYEDFDSIITWNLWTDISSHISNLTLSKFWVG